MGTNTGVRTSFIPKTSLAVRPPKREGLGFLMFLGLTIFLISLLGWLAAYSYNSLVEKDVHNLEAYLTQAKESFDPALLKVFENLDRRLNSAEDIMDAHSDLTPLFVMLDRVTLKTVRYTHFSYINNGAAAAVKISGEALDFPSVALQALEYSKEDKIMNPIFSNFGVEQGGKVTFDVSFNIDTSLVSYAPKTGSPLEGI